MKQGEKLQNYLYRIFNGENFMRKNIELSIDEYNDILDEFYNYFENGYKFEEFLKVYFRKNRVRRGFCDKKIW